MYNPYRKKTAEGKILLLRGGSGELMWRVDVVAKGGNRFSPFSNILRPSSASHDERRDELSCALSLYMNLNY